MEREAGEAKVKGWMTLELEACPAGEDRGFGLGTALLSSRLTTLSQGRYVYLDASGRLCIRSLRK